MNSKSISNQYIHEHKTFLYYNEKRKDVRFRSIAVALDVSVGKFSDLVFT